jgi:transcriptional pleiotropic regulator of transition state genes
VDELGRVVIPIELRLTLGISEKDGLEIFVEGEKVILRRYQPACLFCDSMDEVTEFKGKMICQSCQEEMQNMK